jgi:radical SAM superfamily enzyme YgiQ (UPF0313 family)
MGAKRRRDRENPTRPDESGAVFKDWRGRLRVALAYPNTRSAGMANLGFQTVYGLFNDRDEVVCERLFPPGPDDPGPPRSVESGRVPTDFHILAVSISFESDYIHLLRLLDRSGLPLRAADRGPGMPLVVVGGVAPTLNPEPVAPFADLILIGEAEVLLPPFLDRFDPAADPDALRFRLAREVPGVYVPAFYESRRRSDGLLSEIRPVREVPERVERVYLADLSRSDTCTVVVSGETAFDSAFLVETGRGCAHGCRFCSAGYVYRPPRFRSPEQLRATVARGAASTSRIGLVGAAVSDLPGIRDLCADGSARGVRISFSSLRADALAPELVAALRDGRVRTATVAPEAGSERMRRVINKGLSEADILSAADTLVGAGIPNLKLYFMVGLPTETREDVSAAVELVKRVKERFLAASRPRGRMGEITVGVAAFVPKPVTPFQWAGMDSVAELKAKISIVRDGLRRVANVRVHADGPRHARTQALLARGDRRVADLLEAAYRSGGRSDSGWTRVLKDSPLDVDFHVEREREKDEPFPWEIVRHGVRRAFLRREYERALAGKTSPPCPGPGEGTCRACGVCGED